MHIYGNYKINGMETEWKWKRGFLDLPGEGIDLAFSLRVVQRIDITKYMHSSEWDCNEIDGPTQVARYRRWNEYESDKQCRLDLYVQHLSLQ